MGELLKENITMTLSMVTLHSSDKLLYSLTYVTLMHLKWYSCSLLTEYTDPVAFEHLIILSISNISFPEELEQQSLSSYNIFIFIYFFCFCLRNSIGDLRHLIFYLI